MLFSSSFSSLLVYSLLSLRLSPTARRPIQRFGSRTVKGEGHQNLPSPTVKRIFFPDAPSPSSSLALHLLAECGPPSAGGGRIWRRLAWLSSADKEHLPIKYLSGVGCRVQHSAKSLPSVFRARQSSPIP